MLASWPVVSVDDWSIAGLETQGQHPHDWLKHPSQKRTWLFKPARPERDRSLSEDVVEKLGSELARLVGYLRHRSNWLSVTVSVALWLRTCDCRIGNCRRGRR